MAYTSFKPEIWTGGVLRALRKNRVTGQIVNSSYSGEVTRKGDTVHIRRAAALTSSAYTGTFTYSAAGDSSTALTVDQENIVAFAVPEADAATTDLDIVSIYAEETAVALSEAADAYVLGLVNVAAFDADAVAIDLTVASPDVYGSLVELAKVLNSRNAPRQGRYVVASSDVEAQLLQDDRFLRSTQMGDDVVTNGMIGRAAGFNILASENFVTDAGGVQKLHAGVAGGIGYAEVLMNMRALELEGRRDIGVDGYHVFGSKVIRPEYLVRWDVDTVTP